MVYIVVYVEDDLVDIKQVFDNEPAALQYCRELNKNCSYKSVYDVMKFGVLSESPE